MAAIGSLNTNQGGPKPSGPPIPQPKSSKPVQVKAHTRAAPTPPASKPARTAAPRAQTSPLLNPSQSLSGQNLLNAAKQLAALQTQDPIKELQSQIAQNNAQTKGTIGQVGGFYNQLEPFVQSGVNQQGQIASGLNQTLQGIGQGTQSTLQGIGQGAMASLAKYAPDAAASGATTDLAAQIAREQGLAAQQAGTYQGFGANQGANYQGMGASQLGTFGLQGQEALKGIAQSGTVKNQPLVSKIAGLRAQQGALAATDLGKLRQQEVNNRIAEAGLNLKGQALQTTAANDAANQALKAASIKVTAANDAANQALKGRSISVQQQNNLAGQALKAAQLNEKTRNDAANQALKQAALNLKAAQGQGGAVKPLSTQQNDSMYRLLAQAQQLITDGQGHKLSEAQIRANLQDGANPAKRAFDPVLIQAAYELKGWGHITPATARAMRAMGMRGGTYNGQPIRVAGPPSSAAKAVGQAGAGSNIGF